MATRRAADQPYPRRAGGSEEEHTRHRPLTLSFSIRGRHFDAQADLNKDGVLDEDEFEAYRMSIRSAVMLALGALGIS